MLSSNNVSCVVVLKEILNHAKRKKKKMKEKVGNNWGCKKLRGGGEKAISGAMEQAAREGGKGSKQLNKKGV